MRRGKAGARILMKKDVVVRCTKCGKLFDGEAPSDNRKGDQICLDCYLFWRDER